MSSSGFLEKLRGRVVKNLVGTRVLAEIRAPRARKQLTVLLLFLVLMFGLSNDFWVTPLRVPAANASVSSSWRYSNMGYRVEHNVVGSPAGSQTNYQMKITIVNGTGMSNESVYYTTHVNQSHFDDVRFTWYNTTSGQEEEIDYWCEEVKSGSNATFWVEIPEVSNVTDNTIYIYYGNDDTATTSNVDATFTRVINGNQPVVLALPMDEENGNKIYDYGGNDNDGAVYPTPVEINNCDNTTDWNGTSLSLETGDKVEGSASIKDTIPGSTAGTDYDTCYNPSGSWDWSSKKHIVFWLKCDHASTAFTNARLVLVDTSNRERYWDISFDADEWTRIKEKLDSFDAEDTDFDLAAVDKVVIKFKATDTTDFYKVVDYIQIDDVAQRTDGKFGKALSFDGADDYVEVVHSESLDIAEAITVEAWVKLSASPNWYGRVVTKEGANGPVYVLQARGVNSQWWFTVFVSGTPYYATSSSGWDTDWHHVVGTYDRETVRIYIDGVEGTLNAEPNENIDTNAENLSIGGFSGAISREQFNGTIDEVRIYRRALSAEEIFDLYNYYGYVTTNYAGRVLVRKRIDPEPSHGKWGSEVPYVPVHDIAVVSVAFSSAEVVKGDSIDILVEVKNEGTESETFNVTACYDNNIIGTQTNVSLRPRDHRILTFAWNTTDVFPGSHNVSALVSIVLGETDTDDNTLTDGTVKVIGGHPVAYFTYSPINPLVNETVTFNASLSTPNGGTIVNYTWDFCDGFYGNGVIVYHNYSKTGTYNVTVTVTDSEMANNTAWATITVFTHSLAIISVTPSTNEIYEGQTMNVNVVVQNNGNLTETFNITIYANTTIIQTQTVSNLAPNSQTTLSFFWNTTGTSPGNYTIKAEASIIPEETCVAQTISVHAPPSWYAPLVTWLTSIPPLIWVGISIPVIIVVLFRLRLLEVEVERPLEPAEELQHLIDRVLQPLAKKDKRFIPLQQFLHRLLEENPPPETIEFLQSALPIIVKAIKEPEEETEKHKRTPTIPVELSNIDVAKQIHKDVGRLLKGSSIEDQETVLKEALKIVESVKRIQQIASKGRTQA